MTTHTRPKPVPPSAPPTSNGPPTSDSLRERWLHGGATLEEATRVRAYQLWEHAGRPEGDGVSFWLEAENLLLTHG